MKISNKRWTGERLETFVYNETTIEHLHRYAIAQEYSREKIVLDIACGEGFGANLLSTVAKTVIGVDKDRATISKAKTKYIKPNLQFIEGLAENIPAADHSIDVVVSFETLEHLTDHEKMFSEIKRVLKPEGLLIISTPDKKYYSELPGYNNPFHEKELYEQQFRDLIKGFFGYHFLFYQKVLLASIALLGTESRIMQYTGDYEKIESQQLIDPVYLVAIASDSEIKKPASSIFNGQSIFQKALDEKEKSLKNTISYRIGHYILFPIKVVRKLFKK